MCNQEGFVGKCGEKWRCRLPERAIRLKSAFNSVLDAFKTCTPIWILFIAAFNHLDLQLGITASLLVKKSTSDAELFQIFLVDL